MTERIWLKSYPPGVPADLPPLPYSSLVGLMEESFEKNAAKKGNLTIAKGYLNYLYSPAGQEIAARNFYRPRNVAVLKKYSNIFKPLKLVTIDKEFGGWTKVQKQHFDNGGVFDQIVKINSAEK